MRRAKFFSKIDLKSGFWQITLNPKIRHLTAFRVGSKLYQWKVMPMGLRNAPATFQRLIDNILKGIKENFCFGFLDDIIVFSENFEDHLAHLEEVLTRLEKAGVRINFAKCEWAMSRVKYLGHIVSFGKIEMDPDKLAAIRDFPYPENVKKVQKFLGLTGYYRKFIYRYADIAQPLTRLTRQDTPWVFGPEEKRACNTLKSLMLEKPILTQPDFDRQFYLDTDASGVGLGAVLLQLGDDGTFRPVAYISRQLNKQELNYSVREIEGLAIFWAVNKLTEFLRGRPFTVITDHHSLSWMRDVDPSGKTQKRLYRWIDKLETNFTFNILYREGKQNLIADALSRSPLKTRINLIKTVIETAQLTRGAARADTVTYVLGTRNKKRVDYRKLHEGTSGQKRVTEQIQHTGNKKKKVDRDYKNNDKLRKPKEKEVKNKDENRNEEEGGERKGEERGRQESKAEGKDERRREEEKEGKAEGKMEGGERRETEEEKEEKKELLSIPSPLGSDNKYEIPNILPIPDRAAWIQEYRLDPEFRDFLNF